MSLFRFIRIFCAYLHERSLITPTQDTVIKSHGKVKQVHIFIVEAFRDLPLQVRKYAKVASQAWRQCALSKRHSPTFMSVTTTFTPSLIN